MWLGGSFDLAGRDPGDRERPGRGSPWRFAGDSAKVEWTRPSDLKSSLRSRFPGEPGVRSRGPARSPAKASRTGRDPHAPMWLRRPGRFAVPADFLSVRRKKESSPAMRIYVGNLDYAVTSDELRALFEPFGAVTMAEVQVKSRTGQSPRLRPGRDAERRRGRGRPSPRSTARNTRSRADVNESRPRRTVRDLYAAAAGSAAAVAERGSADRADSSPAIAAACRRNLAIGVHRAESVAPAEPALPRLRRPTRDDQDRTRTQPGRLHRPGKPGDGVPEPAQDPSSRSRRCSSGWSRRAS